MYGVYEIGKVYKNHIDDVPKFGGMKQRVQEKKDKQKQANKERTLEDSLPKNEKRSERNENRRAASKYINTHDFFFWLFLCSHLLRPLGKSE